MSRWKARLNLVFKKEHGERQDADLLFANDWKCDYLPEILESFSRENIFNADETGLYFCGYPDRGHCTKVSVLVGGKKAKDRIIVLLCANMSGSDKCPQFVIGKSKQPHCFPKDLSRLPVDYDSS